MIDVTPTNCMPLSVNTANGSSRLLTLIFASLPQAYFDKRIKPNQEQGGAYCQVSGIWYPASQLRVDGYGRRVGVDYWVPGRPECPS